MTGPHSLDALFLTNFSDYCFRSIPAVAQMADSLHMRLTILHVYDPAKSSEKKAETQVNSFFPEADRYSHCRRIAVAGSVIETVRRHLSLWPTNLLIAPVSDPIGLPRPGERSMRAHLLDESGTPVWTVGRHVDWTKMSQPIQNVACWLDFYDTETNHLAFAIDYAKKMNATLHLVRGLPSISEGSLRPPADQTRALTPEKAVGEILQMCKDKSVRPQVHVAFGQGWEAMTGLLRECDASVVFMRKQESFLSKWLGWGSSMGAKLPCPVIYVGDRLSVPVWNLQKASDRLPAMGMPSLALELGL